MMTDVDGLYGENRELRRHLVWWYPHSFKTAVLASHLGQFVHTLSLSY